MSDLPEYLTAGVTGASAILIYLQLRLDHERSRRDTAVRLLKEWTGKQKVETSAVRRLVAEFDVAQCRRLFRQQEISLMYSEQNLEYALAALRRDVPTLKEEEVRKGDWIVLDNTHIAVLRFVALKYLNLLESTLAAWNAGIASESIIREQFSFLRTVHASSLPDLREAIQKENAQVDSYPSITNFLLLETPKPRRPLRLLGRPG